MQGMGMLDTGSSAGFLDVLFDAYSMLEKLQEAVNKLKIKAVTARPGALGKEPVRDPHMPRKFVHFSKAAKEEEK